MDCTDLRCISVSIDSAIICIKTEDWMGEVGLRINRKARFISAAGLAVGLVSIRAVTAATIRADVSESQYQTLSAQTQYAASGFVDGLGSPGSFGSGTLIAPD